MSNEPTLADLAVEGIPFPLFPPFELEGIPIPIDILDSLVSRYLPGRVRGWVDFQREEITPVSVRYELYQSELGKLGTIQLFKTGNEESSMFVSMPLTFANREIAKRRREHNREVIEVLFGLLATDTAWQKHWKKAQENWRKAGNPIEPSSQLLSRMKAMHSALVERLDLIQRDLTAIYKHIDDKTQFELESILQEIRLGRIEQGKLQAVLDAVRRALKYQQTTGQSINDKELKETLDRTAQSINSGLPLQESLELAIPIIPLLLTYKVEIGGNVDLIAMWNELVEMIQNKGDAK